MTTWPVALFLLVGLIWIAATIACALSCLYDGVIWLWRKLT